MKSDEYQKFENTMKQLAKVSHAGIKAKLDAEKEGKKPKTGRSIKKRSHSG